MWREEREEGPYGAPASGKPRRNPLSWAVLVPVVLLLPPYHFRGVFDVILPASGLLFLGLYFAKSRFAWHVLAAALLIVLPLYIFFSFSWRFQRALHPGIIWVPIVGTLLTLIWVVRSRRPYFEYLEQQHQSEEHERI